MGSLAPSSSPLVRKRCPEFGFSRLSASLIDLPVTHEDPPATATMMPTLTQTHPFRTRSRLVCAPSLEPPQLHRRQSFVIRKSRTRLSLLRSFRPIFWTQRTPFLGGKKTPPIHHDQAAQRSQYGCIIPMLLLTWALVTVFPRFSVSTKPTQIAMIRNGRGLSPPSPLGLRSLYPHTSYYLTWHTAPMMHRSHKLATMSSYSGCPLRLSSKGHLHHSRST